MIQLNKLDFKGGQMLNKLYYVFCCCCFFCQNIVFIMISRRGYIFFAVATSEVSTVSSRKSGYFQDELNKNVKQCKIARLFLRR